LRLRRRDRAAGAGRGAGRDRRRARALHGPRVVADVPRGLHPRRGRRRARIARAARGHRRAVAVRRTVRRGRSPDAAAAHRGARPAAVEFCPYREGLLRNAEAQVLYATDGGVRLAVQLSEDGVQRVRADRAAVAQAAEGIVVVDGEARELEVSVSPTALPAGTEIARVAGAPQASAEPVRRGLDLPGLGADASVSGGGAGTTASGARSATAASLWVAALFGAIGGLILNLMPCVFPVIGLKVLGFARHGSEGSAGSRVGALMFTAGVVTSFWLLAGVLLALRAAGEAAGWGFQLQSPLFVAAMALLFVAIA